MAIPKFIAAPAPSLPTASGKTLPIPKFNAAPTPAAPKKSPLPTITDTTKEEPNTWDTTPISEVPIPLVGNTLKGLVRAPLNLLYWDEGVQARKILRQREKNGEEVSNWEKVASWIPVINKSFGDAETDAAKGEQTDALYKVIGNTVDAGLRTFMSTYGLGGITAFNTTIGAGQDIANAAGVGEYGPEKVMEKGTKAILGDEKNKGWLPTILEKGGMDSANAREMSGIIWNGANLAFGAYANAKAAPIRAKGAKVEAIGKPIEVKPGETFQPIKFTPKKAQVIKSKIVEGVIQNVPSIVASVAASLQLDKDKTAFEKFKDFTKDLPALAIMSAGAVIHTPKAKAAETETKIPKATPPIKAEETVTTPETPIKTEQVAEVSKPIEMPSDIAKPVSVPTVTSPDVPTGTTEGTITTASTKKSKPLPIIKTSEPIATEEVGKDTNVPTKMPSDIATENTGAEFQKGATKTAPGVVDLSKEKRSTPEDLNKDIDYYQKQFSKLGVVVNRNNIGKILMAGGKEVLGAYLNGEVLIGRGVKGSVGHEFAHAWIDLALHPDEARDVYNEISNRFDLKGQDVKEFLADRIRDVTEGDRTFLGKLTNTARDIVNRLVDFYKKLTGQEQSSLNKVVRQARKGLVVDMNAPTDTLLAQRIAATKEITTKFVNNLKSKNKEYVSRKEIENNLGQQGYKDADIAIIRDALNSIEGDKIKVEDIDNFVSDRLLKLDYDNVDKWSNFGVERAGFNGGEKTTSTLYKGPNKTWGGDIHFDENAVSGVDRYFGHTREIKQKDGSIIIEIQSDFFQNKPNVIDNNNITLAQADGIYGQRNVMDAILGNSPLNVIEKIVKNNIKYIPDYEFIRALNESGNEKKNQMLIKYLGYKVASFGDDYKKIPQKYRIPLIKQELETASEYSYISKINSLSFDPKLQRYVYDRFVAQHKNLPTAFSNRLVDLLNYQQVSKNIKDDVITNHMDKMNDLSLRDVLENSRYEPAVTKAYELLLGDRLSKVNEKILGVPFVANVASKMINNTYNDTVAADIYEKCKSQFTTSHYKTIAKDARNPKVAEDAFNQLNINDLSFNELDEIINKTSSGKVQEKIFDLMEDPSYKRRLGDEPIDELQDRLIGMLRVAKSKAFGNKVYKLAKDNYILITELSDNILLKGGDVADEIVIEHLKRERNNIKNELLRSILNISLMTPTFQPKLTHFIDVLNIYKSTGGRLSSSNIISLLHRGYSTPLKRLVAKETSELGPRDIITVLDNLNEVDKNNGIAKLLINEFKNSDFTNGNVSTLLEMENINDYMSADEQIALMKAPGLQLNNSHYVDIISKNPNLKVKDYAISKLNDLRLYNLGNLIKNLDADRQDKILDKMYKGEYMGLGKEFELAMYLKNPKLALKYFNSSSHMLKINEIKELKEYAASLEVRQAAAEIMKKNEDYQTFKNNWHERIIKQIFQEKARRGDKAVFFAMPRTMALIEGFFGEPPYRALGGEDIGNRISIQTEIDGQFIDGVYSIVGKNGDMLTLDVNGKRVDIVAPSKIPKDLPMEYKVSQYLQNKAWKSVIEFYENKVIPYVEKYAREKGATVSTVKIKGNEYLRVDFPKADEAKMSKLTGPFEAFQKGAEFQSIAEGDEGFTNPELGLSKEEAIKLAQKDAAGAKIISSRKLTPEQLDTYKNVWSKDPANAGKSMRDYMDEVIPVTETPSIVDEVAPETAKEPITTERIMEGGKQQPKTVEPTTSIVDEVAPETVKETPTQTSMFGEEPAPIVEPKPKKTPLPKMAEEPKATETPIPFTSEEPKATETPMTTEGQGQLFETPKTDVAIAKAISRKQKGVLNKIRALFGMTVPNAEVTLEDIINSDNDKMVLNIPEEAPITNLEQLDKALNERFAQYNLGNPLEPVGKNTSIETRLKARLKTAYFRLKHKLESPFDIVPDVTPEGKPRTVATEAALKEAKNRVSTDSMKEITKDLSKNPKNVRLKAGVRAGVTGRGIQAIAWLNRTFGATTALNNIVVKLKDGTERTASEIMRAFQTAKRHIATNLFLLTAEKTFSKMYGDEVDDMFDKVNADKEKIVNSSKAVGEISATNDKASEQILRIFEKIIGGKNYVDNLPLLQLSEKYKRIEKVGAMQHLYHYNPDYFKANFPEIATYLDGLQKGLDEALAIIYPTAAAEFKERKLLGFIDKDYKHDFILDDIFDTYLKNSDLTYKKRGKTYTFETYKQLKQFMIMEGKSFKGTNLSSILKNKKGIEYLYVQSDALRLLDYLNEFGETIGNDEIFKFRSELTSSLDPKIRDYTRNFLGGKFLFEDIVLQLTGINPYIDSLAPNLIRKTARLGVMKVLLGNVKTLVQAIYSGGAKTLLNNLLFSRTKEDLKINFDKVGPTLEKYGFIEKKDFGPRASQMEKNGSLLSVYFWSGGSVDKYFKALTSISMMRAMILMKDPAFKGDAEAVCARFDEIYQNSTTSEKIKMQSDIQSVNETISNFGNDGRSGLKLLSFIPGMSSLKAFGISQVGTNLKAINNILDGIYAKATGKDAEGGAKAIKASGILGTQVGAYYLTFVAAKLAYQAYLSFIGRNDDDNEVADEYAKRTASQLVGSPVDLAINATFGLLNSIAFIPLKDVKTIATMIASLARDGGNEALGVALDKLAAGTAAYQTANNVSNGALDKFLKDNLGIRYIDPKKFTSGGNIKGVDSGSLFGEYGNRIFNTILFDLDSTTANLVSRKIKAYADAIKTAQENGVPFDPKDAEISLLDRYIEDIGLKIGFIAKDYQEFAGAGQKPENMDKNYDLPGFAIYLLYGKDMDIAKYRNYTYSMLKNIEEYKKTGKPMDFQELSNLIGLNDPFVAQDAQDKNMTNIKNNTDKIESYLGQMYPSLRQDYGGDIMAMTEDLKQNDPVGYNNFIAGLVRMKMAIDKGGVDAVGDAQAAKNLGSEFSSGKNKNIIDAAIATYNDTKPLSTSLAESIKSVMKEFPTANRKDIETRMATIEAIVTLVAKDAAYTKNAADSIAEMVNSLTQSDIDMLYTMSIAEGKNVFENYPKTRELLIYSLGLRGKDVSEEKFPETAPLLGKETPPPAETPAETTTQSAIPTMPVTGQETPKTYNALDKVIVSSTLTKKDYDKQDKAFAKKSTTLLKKLGYDKKSKQSQKKPPLTIKTSSQSEITKKMSSLEKILNIHKSKK